MNTLSRFMLGLAAADSIRAAVDSIRAVAGSIRATAGSVLIIAGSVLLLAVPALAAQNHAPNPYAPEEGWAKMPYGRAWGATSAVYPDIDGRHIWVGERCEANSCVGRDDLDPILLFDPEGNVVRSFGAGMIVWPHGIHVDGDGNVWLTDARGEGDMGHQVHKFSPEGELLLSLGQPGVAGDGPNQFNGPSDVLVAPNGDIFVADGHGSGGNNRIVKFSSDGTYITAWGSTGAEAGEFRDPHALAMDSQGRLFVGDRGNSRIQIFTQDGEHLETWTQFGRPSGLYIDSNDVLYSADSESGASWSENFGWLRGIRIGSVTDAYVTAFIPDPAPPSLDNGTTAAEGVAVDAAGNVYGAEVGPRQLRKYVRP
ncbi:MAG: peptidyl-alpha-hydroxyglycine alpha-amidating lyase family protein [Gemmatimonadetes bacterium]|nr:peptidyl-alpha-hydroxyglycine alpha-amidating lyase family protein [Gemmatimonadota bacterium]